MKSRHDKQPSPAPQMSFEDELRVVAAEAVVERRADPRQPSNYNAECMLGPVAYVVAIRDISGGGACLQITQGIVPREGQDVTLRLMDGRKIDAVVTRSEEKEIGIRFREPIEIGDVSHFDEMGSDFYMSILRVQMVRK